ncbi:MAG: hypothetical protein HY962_07220 [Ignavibacteriae bacterium]|nr:hypothetical protein [Ignavibacteriota bacterium]
MRTLYDDGTLRLRLSDARRDPLVALVAQNDPLRMADARRTLWYDAISGIEYLMESM